MKTGRSLLLSALCYACGLAALLPGSASAVIIGTGDGTQNTTQGSMPAGWNYVGTFGGPNSGVYLGNGWGITAAHIGSIPASASFILPSGTFTTDQPGILLKNPDNSDTDLQLFHLSSNPALASLSISGTTPLATTPIFMVGFGRDPRDANPVYYDVSGDPTNPDWKADANPLTANEGGFHYGVNQLKRWGTNTVNPGGPVVVDVGGRNVTAFFADFYTNKDAYLANPNGATPFEAIASAGDSGGGVFDGSNTLLGVMNAVDGITNEPADTAFFGFNTYMADLSAYRPQIVAITAVPEPSSAAVVLIGAAGLALRRARRR